jgi:hypothetical protein
MKLIKHQALQRPLHIADLDKICYFKLKHINSRIYLFNPLEEDKSLCFMDTFTRLFYANMNEIRYDGCINIFSYDYPIEEVYFTNIKYNLTENNAKLVRTCSSSWFNVKSDVLQTLPDNTFFIFKMSDAICYKMNKDIFYKIYPDTCAIESCAAHNGNYVQKIEIESIEYDIAE